MNISSIIVQTTPQNVEQLANIFKKSDFCDYHLHNEAGYIIVTIEGEDTGVEIGKLKQIQSVPNVLSAEMHYSYNEEELDMLRENIADTKLPDWLNNPDARAQDIRYGGDLKKRKF